MGKHFHIKHIKKNTQRNEHHTFTIKMPSLKTMLLAIAVVILMTLAVDGKVFRRGAKEVGEVCKEGSKENCCFKFTTPQTKAPEDGIDCVGKDGDKDLAGFKRTSGKCEE